MTLDDLVKDIASTVKESISDAIKKVSDKYESRISSLEKALKELPAPEKGEKGDSITIEDVRPLIKEAIEAIEIPLPKDGKDGVSPDPADVAKAMEPLFAKWELDFERRAYNVLDRAVERMPKPKDGKDALEVKDFDIVLGDDMRTLTVSLKAGEQVVQKSIKIPAIIDRGVHSDEKEYSHGDGVTYAGSFWICQKDRPQGKPSSSEDWRLAVKKGRDGKESVKIELPKTAKVGA